MAFLAPLAAGAGAAAPALAASTAAGAGAAAAGGAALGTGLSAGTILGTGAASSGILGGLGLNALGGMTSILPATAAAGAPALVAPALASKGLVAAATPGIFSSAAPALGGLKSLATPGLLQTAGMSPLGGMASMLPAGASTPGLAGLTSVAQAASPLASAGSTVGLEAAKSGIIQNAMTKQAMQNAMMQNMAGGQAAQNLAGTAGSQFTNVAPNLVGRNDILQAFQRAQVNPFKGTELAKTADASNYLTQGARSATDVPSVQNYLTQMPGETSRLGLKMTPSGAETTGLKLSPELAQSITAPKGSPIVSGENFLSNLGNLIKNPSVDAAVDYAKEHPYATAAGAYQLYNAMQPKYEPPPVDKGMIRPYEYNISQRPEAYEAAPGDTSERRYFNTEFVEKPAYAAKEGGLMSLAVGGPVEQMAQQNFVGANTGYPMSQINSPFYSNPMVQRPEAVNTMLPSGDAKVGAFSGEQRFYGGGLTSARTSEPAQSGGYSYSFNPATNEFTQLTSPSSVQSAVPQGYNPVPGRPGEYWTQGSYGSKVFHTFPVSNTPTSPAKPEVTGGIAGSTRPPMQNMQSYYNEPPAPAYQSPAQRLGLTDFYAMMDEQLKQMGGYAAGGGIASLRGQSHLGDYSDGGRLLKGPGDGVSDSIPAVIGERQPARLADGEFVVPARIVSEIGNGSTDAGARKLYAMMDRVQKARRKTVGKGKIAANTRADKHLPA